jgi:required for meiotic nuclear division protein 1
LSRKLSVISDTAEMLTDMIDTQRSLRLEVIIVLLILFEIVITTYEIATR